MFSIAYTHLFNLTVNYCNTPAILKHVIITSVPKPNKTADLGTSYRLISLLCPAAMVLERLLQPELNSLPLSPLSANHHDFRPNQSTISALLHLPQM